LFEFAQHWFQLRRPQIRTATPLFHRSDERAARAAHSACISCSSGVVYRTEQAVRQAGRRLQPSASRYSPASSVAIQR
jgi:hypothetical protein